MPTFSSVKRAATKIALIACTVALTACASTNGARETDGIYDPYEQDNRKVHAFNRKLDEKLVRPAASGYSSFLPDEVENSVSHFAENLGQPSIMVNSLLQGDLRGVGLSMARFLTNTLLGFGGLLDPAETWEIAEHDTDFGETLYKWGAGEGAYIELPGLGPSTVRATTGKVVDLFTNPLSYVVGSPEKYYGTLASTSSRLSDRDRYSSTIDSILYESADSYAQARLIYLQNRRFALGDEGSASSAEDPYSDPYEDPYAQ